MRTEKTDRYLSMAPFIIPPLFHIDFTPYLAFFENCGVLQHYPKGSTLMSFEEQTQTVQLLKSGIVLESSSNVNGLEKGVLCFPCYPIAFAAAIHQQPTVYSVSAYSNVTTVALPYSDYITLIQQHRELLEMSLRFAAFDSRSANATILQNFACSTTEKIYQTIFYYQLACQYYKPLESIKLTQNLLAVLSGVHRTSVAHAVKFLKEQHIIQLEKKNLQVLDSQQLEALAFTNLF